MMQRARTRRGASVLATALTISAIVVGCSRTGDATPDASGSAPASGAPAPHAATAATGEVAGLPLACPLLPPETAAKLSKKPLAPSGVEKVVGRVRTCEYKPAAGHGLVSGQVGPSDGSAAEYAAMCPKTGGTPVSGVGAWGCFRGSEASGGILSTGNGKYEIGVMGDVPLDRLRSAAADMLAKLPK